MPRAFLIRRQYSAPVDIENTNESRENSPERSVSTAEDNFYTYITELSSPVKPASPKSPACLSRLSDYFVALPLMAYFGDEQKEPLSLTVERSSPAHHLEQNDAKVTGGEPIQKEVLQNRQMVSEMSTCDSHCCPDCGKVYSTSSNLARHRQTHRNVADKKSRKCPHCQKVYVSMPAFSMHVRTHSQGCQCPYCGKCFSRPWLLQGHIRTHTGEKPFACPVCNKAFADKSNLRAHIQTHSTNKPFICQRCGKAFALKSYLYKHEESSCMRLNKPRSSGRGENRTSYQHVLKSEQPPSAFNKQMSTQFLKI
ncbi:uncharacterized protein LOC143256840 [Tachypleus tridentatus]|uniref:uncharacterized protein LOC143256840 n=1 Tax=Tachypleus tridentatus TaxID=6853 RepID=UPI003FD14FBB